MRVSGAVSALLLPLLALAGEDAASLLQEPAAPRRKALWTAPEEEEAPTEAPFVSKLMTAMSNREAQHKARQKELKIAQANRLGDIDAQAVPIDTTEFREKVEKVMKYVPFSSVFMPKMKQEENQEGVPLLAAKKTAGNKYKLKEPEKKLDEPSALGKAFRMVKTGASNLMRDQWNRGKNEKTVSWSEVKKKFGIPGSLKEAYEAEKLPANAPRHLKVLEKKMERAAKNMMTKKEEAEEEQTSQMSEDELEWQSHLYADLKTANATEASKESSDEIKMAIKEAIVDGIQDEDVKGGNAEWRKAQKEYRVRKSQYSAGKEFAWPVKGEVREMLWEKLPGSGWCVSSKGEAQFPRTMSRGTVCRDRCAEDPTCPGYAIQDGPSGVCGWYTDRDPKIPKVAAGDSALAFFPAGAAFKEGSADGWESGSCMRKKLPFYWMRHPKDKSKRLFGR